MVISMERLGKNPHKNFTVAYQLDKGSGHINACSKIALAEIDVDIIYCKPRPPYHKQHIEKFFGAWTTSMSLCTPCRLLSKHGPQ